MKFEGGKLEIVKQINVQNPVRSVSWNTQKPNILAAGLFSGDIVLVDSETYKTIQVLKGCEDKVLSLKWHPFFDYILASGSADNYVRVWDTKNVSLIWFIFAREWAQKLGVPQIKSEKLVLEL